MGWTVLSRLYCPHSKQVGCMACFTTWDEVVSHANSVAYLHPANSAVGHYPSNYEVGKIGCDTWSCWWPLQILTHMVHGAILPGEQKFNEGCWADDILGKCYFDDCLCQGCTAWYLLFSRGLCHVCHRTIFYTHFSSFLVPFPLHFLGLFYSIRPISIPQHHTRSFSFLLPFLKTCKQTARRWRRYSIEGC